MKTGSSFFLTIIAVFFLYSPFVALASQVNIADIAVTPSEAPQVGVPLTVTVNASSSDGSPVYYKFYYCANYGTSAYATTPWTMVQNYSTSNTAQYTFNQAGKYIIVVRAVTDPNNEPASLPIVGHVVDVGGTNDVTLTGLSRNPSTSATVGQTVQFTASAVTYLNDVIYYKFYYCANYGTDSYATTPWTMIQDYLTLNTCDYTFPATGDYIVVVRAVTDPNNESAALPIVGQTVTVTSSDTPSCTYSISPSSGTFTSNGGAASISVSASSSNCSWTATESLDWVTLSPTNGTGNQNVTMSVAANTGTARNGLVTIAGKAYSISQTAGLSEEGRQEEILFISSRAGNSEIYKIKDDGTGLVRLTSTVSDEHYARWSPDRNNIIYTKNDQIWLMDSNGGNQRYLIEGRHGVFSPDGTKIAYSAYSGLRDGRYAIFIYDLTTEQGTKIFCSVGYDEHPDWSPDGLEIVFSTRFNSYGGDQAYIVKINADGSGVVVLTHINSDFNKYAFAKSPKWSPDGSKILYHYLDKRSFFNYEIFVMNPDGSGSTRLTHDSNSSMANCWAIWSPNGNKIAFRSGSPGAIHIMNSNGSQKITLTNAGYNYPTDWTSYLP